VPSAEVGNCPSGRCRPRDASTGRRPRRSGGGRRLFVGPARIAPQDQALSVEAWIRRSARGGGCPSIRCPGRELSIGPTDRCRPLGLGFPLKAGGIFDPGRFHPSPARRFRVRASFAGASRVRLPPIYAFRVRFPSIDATRVRLLSARASWVRFLAFCASRVHLSSVGASRVRLWSIGATRVRPLSIWGRKTALDGRIANPDSTDGLNPNPVFRQRPEPEPETSSTARTRTQLPRTVRTRTLFATEDWNPSPACRQRQEPEPGMPSTAGTRTMFSQTVRARFLLPRTAGTRTQLPRPGPEPNMLPAVQI